ncbi:hypothetical protein EDB85DRAFT_2037105 [Lactarius pseudohatsudake]|nr:hypothetical protein EDB85DRAFT_2037105 [Lactarius pseudohatsudake]
MDDEQWLQLVRTFDGTKDLHVPGELAIDILHALRPGEEEHKIVFPSLRNLHVREYMPMQGPLRDSVDSFVTQRRLSNHPVQINPPLRAQIDNLPKGLVDMPVQQLSNFYSQLMRAVEDGEKNLNAAGASTSDEGDMQRRAFRARLDQQKQLLVIIPELINSKRQGYV